MRYVRGVTLSLVLLLSALNAAGQDAGYRLYRLHYANSDWEYGITTLYYDYSGVNTGAFWELLDGTRTSENEHTFDEYGNWVRKDRTFSDGVTSRETYEYDEAGNLVREFFEHSDGRQGTAKYEYDAAGRMRRMVCELYKGWFTGVIIFEWDEVGRKERGQIQRDGETIGHIEYRYDNSGLLIKEHWELSGTWSQTFVYEYESVPSILYTSSNVFLFFNNPDYRVIGETYDYNGENGGPSSFEYDNDGKLVRKAFERSDGLRTVTTYVYAKNGLLTSSSRSYSDGKTASFSYDYDDRKRLTERKFNRSDGLKGVEAFEYDSSGGLVRARYENMDAWLTGSLTFTHGKYNRLDRGRFEGERFDADLTFDYDDDGNLTRVHWVFSFGETQTYLFEYERKE